MNFGTEIKNYRKEKNLSLREVAKLIGVSHAHLRNIEKGTDPRSGDEIKPTTEVIRLITNFYKMDYVEVLMRLGHLSLEDIKKYRNKI